MKLMFGVESRTDLAAYRAIISGLLGREIEAEFRELRPNKLRVAAPIAREAHQLGLDGVVLAIDNDGVGPFHEAHGQELSSGCRHCSLRDLARVDEIRTWPRPALPRFGIVLGVPVQTIETWLLLVKGHPFTGDHRAIGEIADGRRQLKRWLYGSDEPSLETMQRVTTEVTSTMDAAALASASRSFAHFSDQVRSELSPP